MKKNSVHSLYLNLSKASSGRKFFIAFLAGLLSIFALPPIHFFLVLFLTIPTLIWLLDNIDDSRISFFVGWFFGLGYFLGGLYWIAYSFFVDADQFAWLAPFAILALISLLSIFIGLVTLVFSKFNVFGSGRALIFSSVWVIMEWLRGHIFTGLPWNLIGSSLTFSDELIQVSSIFGAWGLSFFAVLSFSFLGCVRPKFLFKNPSYTTIPFLILIILWCGGHARLFFAEENFFPNIRINIIQANIQQEDKWIPENREKIFFKHLEITRDSFKGRVEGEDLELFIWPETAIPFLLDGDRQVVQIIEKNIPENGFLFSGGVRQERIQNSETSFWNSIFFFNNTGEKIGFYDKFHLVPFGEYVPFRKIIPFKKITQGLSDFSSGDGIKTIHLQNIPSFSPLVCFEAIFPGKVADRLDKPKWLLNVTNDAWFGFSSGPYQHFAGVKLRSVEEGVALVRAANTGISAVIDSYGRVVNRLDLLTEGYIDTYLPKPIESGTFYGKFGDRVFFVFLLILFLFIKIKNKLQGNKIEKY